MTRSSPDGDPTKANVLVTCAGKWVGMVLGLNQAMDQVTPLAGGQLIVADRASVTAAGAFADRAEIVPEIVDPGYVDALLELCEQRSIRVVVPIIDADMNRLAEHTDRFETLGTAVVLPSPELVRLCFDKAEFQEFATSQGLNPPHRYLAHELPDASYPLFYKPVRGFGSVGAGTCATPDDALALASVRTLIFQERVQAPEVSVDAFVSITGRCTLMVQRVRDKVIGGESVQSHTIKDLGIRRLARRAVEALAGRGFHGPLNIQIFATAPPKIVEINPRLGSASVFSNFASSGRLFRSVLAEACGLVAEGDPDDYAEGMHLYRYLGDVYHDGARVLGGTFSDGR